MKRSIFYWLACALVTIALINMGMVIYEYLNEIPIPMYQKIGIPVMMLVGYICALIDMEERD